MTQTVQDDINTQNINMQPKCKEFKACVAQEKTLIHKGDVFAYKNRNNEVQCKNVNFVSRSARSVQLFIAQFYSSVALYIRDLNMS